MIKDKFLEAIKEYKLLKPRDNVLIAVSGGADSTALLNLLHSHKDQLGITLHIAHLNHLIRRRDAELDVRYVQDLAQRLAIPVTVESIDVPAFAKKEKMSLEAAARQVRYAFFEKTAKRVGANKIAVGHTADDNVETFLMRLLRGAGLKGLCGIPARRGKIIRPLIKVWRKQIEEYIGGLKLVPRRDYTNFESRYMRNRVRLKLIPQLKVYNLNIKEIILQTVLLLTDDNEYLEAKAQEALSKALISASDKEIKLDIGKLRGVESPIQRHLARKAIEKVKGNLTNLSYTHVYDIIDNLDAMEKWELHLPDGVVVLGNRERLVVTREKPKTKEKISYYYQLAVPGEIEIKELGKKIRASRVDKKEFEKDDNNQQVAFVDGGMLGRNLIVRSRGEGDRFCPLGMKGTKKLQDFFVDEKIAAEARDTVPVVESSGRIIWVAGLRLDERAKITKNTKKAVKLELL